MTTYKIAKLVDGIETIVPYTETSRKADIKKMFARFIKGMEKDTNYHINWRNYGWVESAFYGSLSITEGEYYIVKN